MGTFADSLFTVLMSWVRALVNAFWALFSSEHTTLLEYLGKNWLMIAVVIIAAGLMIDWIIWLLRWQPYHLWAQRARKVLHIEAPQEENDPEETPQRAHAAKMPERRTYAEEPAYSTEEELPMLAEEEEISVLEHAQSAPDEYAYPGMRYDSPAAQDMGSTQRYGAVTQQGPGAAEVARRKAEIEAWQLQMQQEARERAEAERREREAQEAYEAEQARLAQEAYEAEQARLAQKAYEAEQARLAQEAYEAEQARLAQEAYEAEQARLAQEEYQRQLAEYERQKAQYELELAEYERQKAAYDAQQAALQQETAQEIAPESMPAQGAVRRRRSARKTYSDYVEGDAVADLPDAPEWPDVLSQPMTQAPQDRKASSRLLSRMAKMIDPEEEELASRTKLPPRVNMQDAYKPAVGPGKPGRRSRKA